MRVPDAELAGLDIVGVYAFEDLGGGELGPLILHLRPFGIDGRGMCPDREGPPAPVCYTGGIDHSMVTITRQQIEDGGGQVANLIPRRPRRCSRRSGARSATCASPPRTS